MEKGAQVWAVDSDGDDAWILCEVLSKTDTELKLQQIEKDSNAFTRSRVDAKPAAGANDEVVEIRYEGVELANAKLSEVDRAEGRDDDLIGRAVHKALWIKILRVHNNAIHVCEYFKFGRNPCVISIRRCAITNTIAYLTIHKRFNHPVFLRLFSNPFVRHNGHWWLPFY